MAVSGRKAEDFSPSMLLGSDDHTYLYCVPCDSQGTRIQAYGYCVDCYEHLCETCYQVHTKPTPCRNHVLLDKSRMPKCQSLLECSGDIPTRCSKHNEKIIEYTCNDHDALACNVCVAMEHRNCKIDYIPDVSKGYRTSTEFKSVKESVNALQANIDKAKIANSARQQEIEDNRNKVKQDIILHRKSLDIILKKWEEDTLKQADIIFDGFLATCKTVEEHCDKFLVDLSRLQHMFKSVDEQEQLLYVCVKKHARQISEQQQTFADLDMDYFHPGLFVFQANSQLKTLLQSDSKFGNLTKRKRAENILAKQKEIKEVERQRRVNSEKVRLESLPDGFFVLKLLDLKEQLRQLKKAESQDPSLN